MKLFLVAVALSACADESSSSPAKVVATRRPSRNGARADTDLDGIGISGDTLRRSQSCRGAPAPKVEVGVVPVTA